MKIFEKWKNRETKKKLRERIAQLEKDLRFDNRPVFNVERREVRTIRAQVCEPMNETPPFFETHARGVLERKISNELKDYINYSKRYDDVLGRNVHVAEIKVVDMGGI